VTEEKKEKSDSPAYDEAKKNDSEGKELCRNFRNRGNCHFGDKCNFSHEAGPAIGDPKPTGRRRRRRRGAEDGSPTGAEPKAPGLCFSWTKEKSCQYGDECRFKHGEDDTRESVQPGAQRKAKGECYKFRETGECDFGDKCRFSHEKSDDTGAADENEEDVGDEEQ